MPKSGSEHTLPEQELRLNNRVREVRRRLKMRQTDLAHEAGVTRQSIIAIEKTRLAPSVYVALRIARALREPVDYLFFLDRHSPADTSDVAPSSSSYETVVPPDIPDTLDELDDASSPETDENSQFEEPSGSPNQVFWDFD